jgi:hypothetical protein
VVIGVELDRDDHVSIPRNYDWEMAKTHEPDLTGFENQNKK